MSQRDFVSRLAPILPLVAERADWTDEHRRPDEEVFRRLASAGVLRMMAPSHYGGQGAGPEEFLSAVEAIAEVDGSAAWTMMTLNEELGLAAAYLPAESMTSLLSTEPDLIIAGSGLSRGRARAAPGGWIVNGRWKFVSGSTVADRLILASLVDSDDPEGPGTPRRPRTSCFTLVPVDEVEIEPTWQVAGLRGTGSNDVVLCDVFVPDKWAGVIGAGGRPVPETAFFCLPNGLRFPFPKVGVAVGIARAAIDAFGLLARNKKPSMLPELLAERPSAQAALARAESMVGAGRAWTGQQMDVLWSVASTSRPIEPELHARVRLACSYAVDSAIRAVEVLASAAGTTASRLDGPWPRLLADVRSVGQHFMVGPQQMQTAGRVLLGQDPGDPTF